MVSFLRGGESEIRTRASGITRTNPLAGGPLIASWVFLRVGYKRYFIYGSLYILA